MDSSSLIGIMGANSEGAEVAAAASLGGFSVLLVDVSKESLERGVESIRRLLQKRVEKKELSDAERNSAIARIQLGLDPVALAKTPFIIDTASDNDDSLRKLENTLSPQAILAFTAHHFSITKLARLSKKPAQVVGMHFLKPVLTHPVVEVVRGVQTSDATLQVVRALVVKLGKHAVVANDFPGFVVNRLQASVINEAVCLLYEGVASAEDIDQSMKVEVSPGVTLGALALADTLGLDHVLSHLYVLQREFGNPKYSPCPLLVKYVEAGYLGRKTGKGFYEY